ncbi:hypothetical protein H6504_01625 [Candidatus Woesearchaeota archaeon]|nr:hypothetical protein [Candidatus Woesearchaeota archaeon]
MDSDIIRHKYETYHQLDFFSAIKPMTSYKFFLAVRHAYDYPELEDIVDQPDFYRRAVWVDNATMKNEYRTWQNKLAANERDHLSKMEEYEKEQNLANALKSASIDYPTPRKPQLRFETVRYIHCVLESKENLHNLSAYAFQEYTPELWQLIQEQDLSAVEAFLDDWTLQDNLLMHLHRMGLNPILSRYKTKNKVHSFYEMVEEITISPELSGHFLPSS